MSAVDAGNFSLDAYRLLLAELTGRGYRTVGFDAVDARSRSHNIARRKHPEFQRHGYIHTIRLP